MASKTRQRFRSIGPRPDSFMGVMFSHCEGEVEWRPRRAYGARMDFRPSPRSEDYANRVRAFLHKHIRPVEMETLRAVSARGSSADWTTWVVSPAVEALKAKAKSEGLWNLFLPDPKRGAGLTN